MDSQTLLGEQQAFQGFRLRSAEMTNGDLRIGLTSTAIAVVLLGIAVAGVAPHNLGGAVGSCSDEGPHLIVLIAWVASALLGAASAILLSTGYGKPKGPTLRRVTFWVAVLVPVGAVALYIWTVADGISECGF